MSNMVLDMDSPKYTAPEEEDRVIRVASHSGILSFFTPDRSGPHVLGSCTKPSICRGIDRRMVASDETDA